MSLVKCPCCEFDAPPMAAKSIPKHHRNLHNGPGGAICGNPSCPYASTLTKTKRRLVEVQSELVQCKLELIQTHESLQVALRAGSCTAYAAGEYQRQLRRNSAVRDRLVPVDEQHAVAATLQHLIAQ